MTALPGLRRQVLFPIRTLMYTEDNNIDSRRSFP